MNNELLAVLLDNHQLLMQSLICLFSKRQAPYVKYMTQMRVSRLSNGFLGFASSPFFLKWAPCLGSRLVSAFPAIAGQFCVEQVTSLFPFFLVNARRLFELSLKQNKGRSFQKKRKLLQNARTKLLLISRMRREMSPAKMHSPSLSLSLPAADRPAKETSFWHQANIPKPSKLLSAASAVGPASIYSSLLSEIGAESRKGTMFDLGTRLRGCEMNWLGFFGAKVVEDHTVDAIYLLSEEWGLCASELKRT